MWQLVSDLRIAGRVRADAWIIQGDGQLPNHGLRM
jgi:hypothetical protein